MRHMDLGEWDKKSKKSKKFENFFFNFFFQFSKINGLSWKNQRIFFFPSFNLQTHWKTALFCLLSVFLSLVKRTIILVIFFKFFKAYLGKQKSGKWNLLENGTQNLTFFSQFVKISKVSSLDFCKFSWYFTAQNLKSKPFFLKADFFQNFQEFWE